MLILNQAAGCRAQEDEDEKVDDIAEELGIRDFSYRLHKAQEREGEEDALRRKRPRKRVSRKKSRERARRMAGMGLLAPGAAASAQPVRPSARRRSSSRSRSPRRRSRSRYARMMPVGLATEFIASVQFVNSTSKYCYLDFVFLATCDGFSCGFDSKHLTAFGTMLFECQHGHATLELRA